MKNNWTSIDERPTQRAAKDGSKRQYRWVSPNQQTAQEHPSKPREGRVVTVLVIVAFVGALFLTPPGRRLMDSIPTGFDSTTLTAVIVPLGDSARGLVDSARTLLHSAQPQLAALLATLLGKLGLQVVPQSQAPDPVIASPVVSPVLPKTPRVSEPMAAQDRQSQQDKTRQGQSKLESSKHGKSVSNSTSTPMQDKPGIQPEQSMPLARPEDAANTGQESATSSPSKTTDPELNLDQYRDITRRL